MRKQGQSQLDYLWVNYGNRFVSDTLEKGSIPTSELLQQLVTGISNDSVNTIKVIGDKLVGNNKSGNPIFSIDISEITTGGRAITNFGKRYITYEDINNGCEYPKDTPVYFLRFSDDSELLAKIDEYKGQETNSVILNISKNLISADLKINNEDSIVPIKETFKGIKADLKIDPNIESIKLTKELEGLKAKIILDNEGRSLKFKYLTLSDYLNIENPDSTTVYFIKDKKYFYFGKYIIGQGSVNLDNYYTKQEIDNNLATKQYVDDLLSDIGLNWKSI